MKTIMLNDSAIIELAHRVIQNVKDGEDRVEAFKNEIVLRMESLNREIQETHKEIWSEIYSLTGLDPNLDYRLDVQYIESCGAVFIEEKPEEPGHISMDQILSEALEI